MEHGFHLTLSETDTALFGKECYPHALLGDFAGNLLFSLQGFILWIILIKSITNEYYLPEIISIRVYT